MKNFMELKFTSNDINESFARSTVAAFCVSENPTIEEINDVKTAVSEAVTNSIVHGYNSEKTGIIVIKVEIEGARAEITVTDFGVGIADINKAMEPFYTTKPNEERSGMGFTIMQSFMDSVAVESNGEGTIVKMVKTFSDKQNA